MIIMQQLKKSEVDHQKQKMVKTINQKIIIKEIKSQMSKEWQIWRTQN